MAQCVAKTLSICCVLKIKIPFRPGYLYTSQSLWFNGGAERKRAVPFQMIWMAQNVQDVSEEEKWEGGLLNIFCFLASKYNPLVRDSYKQEKETNDGLDVSLLILSKGKEMTHE